MQVRDWGVFLAQKEDGAGPFKFAFEQGVEMRRRNEIFVEVLKKENGEAIEKVFLSGNAVKVMEGSLEI